LSDKLDRNSIQYKLLEGTKDIWVRDYLPVLDNTGGSVQFRFNPGYLRSKKYSHLVSDPEILWEQLGLKPSRSELIIDGGNIIMSQDTVITTDFVKKDNPAWTDTDIMEELKKKLKVNRVIIIPHQPHDFTGHADGMVRFIDSKRVLVNDYSGEKEKFRKALLNKTRNAGLGIIPFTYSPDYSPESVNSAKGTYINFLDTGKCILFPLFETETDENALREVTDYFPGHKIIGIESNEIASEGGVLNCIGWVG
jgi:agmatine deiminase